MPNVIPKFLSYDQMSGVNKRTNEWMNESMNEFWMS